MAAVQFILISIALLVSNINCDYYTSVVGLEDLINAEAYMIDAFENHFKTVQELNKGIEKIINEAEKDINRMAQDPKEYYENPLSAFKAIRRIVIDKPVLENLVFAPTIFENFPDEGTILGGAVFSRPILDDLQGAAKGLVRLQETYALETEEIANGMLFDIKYSPDLSASSCFEIGKSLYEVQNYRYAVEWLLEARYKLQKDGGDANFNNRFPYVTNEQILEFLVPAFHNTGNYKMSLTLNEELLSYNPNNKYGLENKALYLHKITEDRRTKMTTNLINAIPHKTEFTELYEKVCRGELEATPAQQRPLRCRYVNNDVPFCLIAPFKMEELSHDPIVSVYHDAIYDNEIDNILNSAESQVTRSKVGDLNVSGYSDVRTSQNTWLHYDQTSFIANIGRRLKDITGLSMKTAEALQVANYGIGGHYGPHYDFSEDPDTAYPGRGNRILTALFYINDVELGGATAFPFLRIAVPPIRRSMVLWYNMHESLELDYRTKHAGCPVLKGSKWICNEWFHQLGQEFIRPCCLVRNGEKSIAYKDIA